MNITVTVDELTLDTVVAKVFGYDEDGDLVTTGKERTVAHLVADQIAAKATADDRYPKLRDDVLKIRQEEIRTAIRPAIEQAIARPIRKTNGWGEPTGPETTLSELIIAEVRSYLGEPVDKYNRDKGTLLSNTIRAEVKRAFAEEIADAVKQARDAVAKEIGDQVSTQIAEAVRKGITSR